MPITIDDSNNIVVTPTLGGGTSASAWAQQLRIIEEEQLRRRITRVSRNFRNTIVPFSSGLTSRPRVEMNHDGERKEVERTTKDEYTIK